jgi:hypothetical protein
MILSHSPKQRSGFLYPRFQSGAGGALPVIGCPERLPRISSGMIDAAQTNKEVAAGLNAGFSTKTDAAHGAL